MSRARLLIAVLVFNLKLLMDGVRDLVLVPASLLCALAGLFFGGEESDRYFRRLLQIGRRSDRFINLFNQHNTDSELDSEPSLTSDEFFAPYEQRLLNHTAKSKLAMKASKLVDDLARPASESDASTDSTDSTNS